MTDSPQNERLTTSGRDYEPLRRWSLRLFLAAIVLAVATLAVTFRGVAPIVRRAGQAAAAGELALALVTGILWRSTRARRWLAAIWSAFPEPDGVESVSMRFRLRDVLFAAALAAAAVAVDVHFSRDLGLLSYPSVFDGVTYVVDAEKVYCRLQESWNHVAPPAHDFYGVPTLPWLGLLLLSYFVFGVGEWQAYTVRFWPIFLLLLLVRWVIRRRGGGERLVWAATIGTVLLPVVSVGVRSAGWEYWTGSATFMLEWYLADLRPDFLFAVLLLWTVVPLVERVEQLTSRVVLTSAAFAGLTALTKPSATPMLFYAWGLAWLYVFLVNCRRWSLLKFLSVGVWTVLPFGLVVSPAVAAGVPRWVINYLTTNLTSGQSYYANPNRTFWTEASFYWHVYPFHLGHVESWLALGLGVPVAVLAIPGMGRRLLAAVSGLFGRFETALTERRADHRLAAHLGLAVALYALVSVTPNKNYFVCIGYFLLLWVLAWLSLAWVASRQGAIGRRLAAENRTAHAASRWPSWLLGGSAAYGLILIAAGLYALAHWPEEERVAGPTNRDQIQRMASDLQEALTEHDSFAYVPAYGLPTTLQFYMVQPGHALPYDHGFDPSRGTNIEQFINDRLTQCQAVLVYGEEMSTIGRYITCNPVAWPYARAVADWVRRPESGFRLAASYKFSDRSPPLINWTDPRFGKLSAATYRLGDNDRHGWTIQLYVRIKERWPLEHAGL